MKITTELCLDLQNFLHHIQSRGGKPWQPLTVEDMHAAAVLHHRLSNAMADPERFRPGTFPDHPDGLPKVLISNHWGPKPAYLHGIETTRKGPRAVVETLGGRIHDVKMENVRCIDNEETTTD